ncbi:4-amino-4-deoxy-L-arabinose-phosphoundecaprenol flippase subunit ArnF [Rahnella sp. Lac-M11]|jgi:undecaprenyl phosphate-alpha-L-ara4N flippase subunit ArnF|uniref:Probable 4-amino-4-deoxy-L-arabinose-phosphoundecaprenol flippase subunit ArnF n=1 Tax=Rahnella contaminans TaxID=2703882 RepID=A0A6M2AZL7_9GAMM|nr:MULTISPECIES: 4-amino-4-deoxy-L-arabinose-phosphoundecaprenol flippase subunit ArnF [Rahnella]MBU9821727.1 4-amino-4-deoxy-L-arabinose-phosphoundecaprenol flippase subunit ArnF [Rahnella sp. BCC 1045]MCS3421794.1 undecaprenyl phosphate-alpha-L-ara4N flippase subunit ArnF [Rahnella sp. BIGb0603]MDF1893528.1 4-amino-4-deoxy-L-arabinose-phosphoundecaprenol flippase subunit ArnF [Rahnella contaminans]NGX85514.1 4-amino-4-deoxy-L-arabinose-phosphoundecaprenol flippase subunit ArnF [Rahnella conta
MKGYLWGGASVLLVTAAQLLMKWGMVQIPWVSLAELNITFIISHLKPLVAVFLGLCGYAFSMGCWFFALRYLPLNRAYTLLSLSYALVYIAAVTLPWFNESISLTKTLGGLLILSGVWLIHSKPVKDVH